MLDSNKSSYTTDGQWPNKDYRIVFIIKIPTIDRVLSISWCLEFEGGMRWFDLSSDPRAWITAKQTITQHKHLKIRRMHLFSKSNITSDTTFNGALTPEYCLGYFYCKKIVAQLQGSSVDLYAIGHMINEQEVDVRWYDTHMSLREREVRPLKKAEIGLIRNNL